MTAPNYIEKSHAQYLKDLERSNNLVYNYLLLELAKFSESGTLQIKESELAQLDSKIKDAVKNSGYSEYTTNYLKTLDEVENIKSKEYAKDKISISDAIKDNEYIKEIKKQLIEHLRGSKLNEAVLKPLENIIRQNVLLNNTFENVANILKSKIIEKPIINNHVDTIAYDTLHQYNGVINEQVRKKNNLRYFYYIGSEIETTRPFCDHMKDNFKGAISVDELEKVLNEFCPNGTPSETKITYETVNGVVRTLKKGSGMIEGTTLENFTINRGGHRCNHEVKWTRYPKK